RAEAALAEDFAKRLSVRMGGIEAPVKSLSGGNQQKVAISKQLAVKPTVILMDEPTRGIDVGAKAEIHRLLRALERSGIGIIVISSEMPELLGLADRVLVVREGHIAGELSADTMSEEAVILLASGVGAERASHHAA
ncbi:ATP-binding cassette domain-containing protein, partial [Sinorhizobium meliloti]|uniref:ATP-binding cassette domain-containing protein n=1 Tax=Rhizobium meliloti TaxID=382 RepID=UPI0030B045AA